ncbi:MAG TPA: HAD hydrolase-like protein, partial [Rhodothermales bacterium]|nr:HAD hydrolase-like protein [Rhodothermales bacterium]
MKLLLFDIDGTLLRTRGVGRQAVTSALSEVCGRSISTDTISFSGRTDPQIFREAVLRNGYTEPDAEQLVPEAFAVYVEMMRQSLKPDTVDVMPGAHDLLARLAEQPNVHLALLTGNLEPTAYLKLEAAGLADYFPFGAFGSDHADRPALPSIAIQRARIHTNHDFTGKNVVIIGDTEHDIRCGDAIG